MRTTSQSKGQSGRWSERRTEEAARQPRKPLLSRTTLALLGAATALTLTGAVYSAALVRSQPTMRAEDSGYETTSKAVIVRRQLAESEGVRLRVATGDLDATGKDHYIARSVALGRRM